MSFELLPFDKNQDMPLLEWWFYKRSYQCPEAKFLPPTGGIVTVEGEAICAGFLFKSDAGVAVIAHLISDPEVPQNVRGPALEFLMHCLQLKAKDDGFGVVTCSTNLPRLMDRFENLGFKKTDEKITSFRRVLCP